MKRTSLFLISAGFAVAALWVFVPRPAVADDSRTKNIEAMIATLEHDWVMDVTRMSLALGRG